MHWTLTILLAASQIVDPDELAAHSVMITDTAASADRQLLCHVLCTEDDAHDDAYSAITCLALEPRPDGAWSMQLAPVLTLTRDEQTTLRTWLVDRRWAAWARAPLHVRELLGAPAPAVQLAEAARQLMLPLATLGRAAQFGRLPVIRAGDRVLVYTATILEARSRGLLHDQAGRPRRG